MHGKLLNALGIGLILLIVLGFWCSSLSFFPVPWPDDSAFYLPGIELVHWPPLYRMHAAAPFFPSYDRANFSTMPLLPLLLGLGNLLGLRNVHAIRIFGMLAFAAWVIALGAWCQRRGTRPLWAWGLCAAVIFSPSLRWGAMVSRTEIYQALLWTLMLMELDGYSTRTSRPPSVWRLPLLLALSAYFHFEAAYWLAPLMLGLWMRGWPRPPIRTWLDLAWRTAILFSPWLLYAGTHFEDLRAQLALAFGRLAFENPGKGTLLSVFHSIFISLGNPEGYPKLYNPAKLLTWMALLACLPWLGYLAARDSRSRGPRIAAASAILVMLYLWFSKPEVWFSTLVHASLWPAVVLSLAISPADGPEGKPESGKFAKMLQTTPVLGLWLMAVLGFATAVMSWEETRYRYTWTRYDTWVGCIERAIGARTRIWQPHYPDVLVNLASRHPEKNYSRHVDFIGLEDAVERHARSSEAIIHSVQILVKDGSADREADTAEIGPLDRFFLTDYPYLL